MQCCCCCCCCCIFYFFFFLRIKNRNCYSLFGILMLDGDMDCFSPVFERTKTNGNSLDILLLQELAIMQYFSSALLQLSFNYLEADI